MYPGCISVLRCLLVDTILMHLWHVSGVYTTKTFYPHDSHLELVDTG